ncbi:regulatory protein GemA [Rhizobium sp. SL86]|uniref:regulatory protein GemA n=1 Tax=Rhizobium sp. SL86 TaxID=2995148 RepID=UPI002275DF26|nr:regulatory protein GemA [Rhizobium sp. SL86]MCY1669319.1 regulatory protein GemA [Rhizobium sp. SL86]
MTTSLAALHIAKKHLGLDDDTYRAKLANLTGKTSAKDMTETERVQVLAVFRNEGFKPDNRQSSKALSGKYAKKLQALWIAGYNLGVFRDRRDSALLAFVKRQTGIDHVRFLHFPDDAHKAIEALKAWLKREAGVMYGNTNGFDWLAKDGAKVAWAQWKILHPDASLSARNGFDETVSALLGKPVLYLAAVTDREWHTVMNGLGVEVRKKRPCPKT